MRTRLMTGMMLVVVVACSAADEETSPGLRTAKGELAAGEVTLWPDSALPKHPNVNDGAAVELGVEVSADVSGTIRGVRFYKGKGNTGRHTAHLWASDGTSLASATFTNETASGWQTVYFASPVAVVPGRTYLASYHTDVGHYAGDNDYFAVPYDRAPLHALGSAYRYGGGGFPDATYRASNYWVDVVFHADATTTPDAGAIADASSTDSGSITDAGSGADANVDCVRGLWQNLEACGYPGPKNTGYPAGSALKTTASRTITVDGTIVDGERIDGGLRIAAKNVIVRNSYISSYFATGEAANGTGVVFVEAGATATLEHNKLDGKLGTHACIWHEGATVTARSNDCYRVNDGIFVWDGGPFTLEDNYVHDLTDQTANGHIDGFQTEGASHGIIRHNTIDIATGQNAAVAIWDSRRDSDDILVERNLLAGGGFTVYAEDYSPSESAPAGGYSVTNVRFVDNRFSTVHFECVGAYGIWYTRGAPTDGWRRSGNLVVETGENVDATNPHTTAGVLCR